MVQDNGTKNVYSICKSDYPLCKNVPYEKKSPENSRYFTKTHRISITIQKLLFLFDLRMPLGTTLSSKSKSTLI